MKGIIKFILTLLIGWLSVACEHKELCYDHSPYAEVEVIFDWRYHPTAHPESMRLYLFPEEGGEPLLYEFPNHTGGIIKLRAGHYKAICYNSDTETIGFRNTGKFETFEAFALQGELAIRGAAAPRAEGTENERLALSPEYLYSDKRTDIQITVTADRQQIILYPQQMVCRYQVEIRNVNNLKEIFMNGVGGSLSSLSGGIMLGTGEPSAEAVTYPFAITEAENQTLQGDFLTFGQSVSELRPHKLVIYVIMKDGSKRYYTFDVTKQVDQAVDPHHVYIVIDELPLPNALNTDGGFHPEVEDWQDVYVDLSM